MKRKMSWSFKSFWKVQLTALGRLVLVMLPYQQLSKHLSNKGLKAGHYPEDTTKKSKPAKLTLTKLLTLLWAPTPQNSIKPSMIELIKLSNQTLSMRATTRSKSWRNMAMIITSILVLIPWEVQKLSRLKMAEITFSQSRIWRRNWMNSKKKQTNKILQSILSRKCRILLFKRLDMQFQALSKTRLILMPWNALMFRLGKPRTKMLVRQLQPSSLSQRLLLQRKMDLKYLVLWYQKTGTENHRYHSPLLCELKIKTSQTETSPLQGQFSSGRLRS